MRRFGRAALLEATEYGAFLACRLREKHAGDVQVRLTAPFNEYADVPDRVREAAVAYEARDRSSTPYDKFAAGTDHPDPATMRERALDEG